MLSTNEIQALEDIFFSIEVESESIDYFSLHGLICSRIVGPGDYSEKEMLDLVFQDQAKCLSSKQKIDLEVILSKLVKQVFHALSQGESVIIPVADQESFEEEAYHHWCIGFIEGFLADEEKWFTHQSEQIAELLLPIMVLSDLFEDDEFAEIRRNELLIDQFYENLSDVLTDLFLFFHSI